MAMAPIHLVRSALIWYCIHWDSSTLLYVYTLHLLPKESDVMPYKLQKISSVVFLSKRNNRSCWTVDKTSARHPQFASPSIFWIVTANNKLRCFTTLHISSTITPCPPVTPPFRRLFRFILRQPTPSATSLCTASSTATEIPHQTTACVLTVAAALLFKMLVKVKLLTGNQTEIDIDPTDTIWRIKERVEEKAGIDPKQQRLIFGGRQLADDRPANEYNIEGGSVLHLVIALRGGAC